MSLYNSGSIFCFLPDLRVKSCKDKDLWELKKPIGKIRLIILGIGGDNLRLPELPMLYIQFSY